jgi:hypothetical protein
MKITFPARLGITFSGENLKFGMMMMIEGGGGGERGKREDGGV